MRSSEEADPTCSRLRERSQMLEERIETVRLEMEQSTRRRDAAQDRSEATEHAIEEDEEDQTGADAF